MQLPVVEQKILIVGLRTICVIVIGFCLYWWLSPFALRPGDGSPKATVLFGDSLTEGYPRDSVGDCEIDRQGHTGFTIKQLADLLPIMSGSNPPTYAVVLAGMNDAAPGLTDADVAALMVDYQRIVESARDRGTTVLIATISPVEPGKRFSNERSDASVRLINAAIERIAAENGIVPIPLHETLSRMDRPGGVTYDGVHLRPTAYETFAALYAKALDEAVTRTGKPC